MDKPNPTPNVFGRNIGRRSIDAIIFEVGVYIYTRNRIIVRKQYTPYSNKNIQELSIKTMIPTGIDGIGSVRDLL